MPQIDNLITWRPDGGYNPSQPFDGDVTNTVFRGKNLIVRGSQQSGVYLETWRGVTAYSDASPPADVALTGTISGTGATITGSGTLFTRELIPGQWVLIANDIYQVYLIASDTSLTLTENLVATVGAGATVYRVQTVVEVDNERGNLIRGSVIRFPNGNLLTVGDGVVRLNGSVLSSSLTASKRLQLSVFDPAAQTYTNYPLGMAVPAAPTLAATGGGTKNMQAGVYSVRITAARVATGGYNNPSPKVEVTLTTGQRIQATLPAMDTASGQDAWDIYVSLFTTGGGIEGPWYLYKTITTADVSSAGGNYTFEYNDAEVSSNRLLSFDNDPPPDACFVASLQGLPILLSCNGRGRKLAGTAATTAGDNTVTGTSTTFTASLNRGQFIYIDSKLYTVTTVTSDTSIEVDPAPLGTASGLDISLADTAPGPVVRPAKPAINGANVEAFPASFKVAVDPPENIIGWVRGAQGRIFLMTENYLHLCSSTGNPDLPATVRPFWRSGFRNPYSLVFVNDTLYGYTRNGPTRSVGDGDQTIEEHSFAAPVAPVFANWVADRVQVAYDPKNEAICFFHATAGSGSNPRLTECLMFMLRLGVWSPTIIIEHGFQNRSLTGAATVAGQLVLTVSGVNYQWDTGTSAISAYASTAFFDAGDPGADKTITGLQMTGYSTSTVNGGIWAASAGEDIPISDLQDGINQDSGNLTFVQGNYSRPSYLQRCNVARARLLAARVNIDWDGSGELGRLDELAIRGNITGRRY